MYKELVAVEKKSVQDNHLIQAIKHFGRRTKSTLSVSMAVIKDYEKDYRRERESKNRRVNVLNATKDTISEMKSSGKLGGGDAANLFTAMHKLEDNEIATLYVVLESLNDHM